MKKIINKKQRVFKSIEPPVWSIKDFYDKRNEVLFIRATGGLGDIMMHRMMYEDIKKTNPDVKIIVAVLPCYFEALQDHPYIDELVDIRIIDQGKFLASYNTTSACNRYEMAIAPLSGLQRSDIWAQHCGVYLKNHDMHINISERGKNFGKEVTNDLKRPITLICPISAMVSKNLLDFQIEGLVNGLRDLNCTVLASHTMYIDSLTALKVPLITKTSVQELWGLIDACDYIVSVDTAQFHIAGGLKKPVTGIFTFADGLVYGKYYPTMTLVQKHRNCDKNWDCGPCYQWVLCPKTIKLQKPCLTEITVDMIMNGVKTMINKFPCKLY